MPDTVVGVEQHLDELRRLTAVQQRMASVERALVTRLAERGASLETFDVFAPGRYEQYMGNHAALGARCAELMKAAGLSPRECSDAIERMDEEPLGEQRRAARMAEHELLTEYRLHSDGSWISQLDSDPTAGRYWERDYPHREPQWGGEFERCVLYGDVQGWNPQPLDSAERFFALVSGDQCDGDPHVRAFDNAQTAYGWAQTKLGWLSPDPQGSGWVTVWDRGIDAVDGRIPDSAVDQLSGPMERLNARLDARFEFFLGRDQHLARIRKLNDQPTVAGLDTYPRFEAPSVDGPDQLPQDQFPDSVRPERPTPDWHDPQIDEQAARLGISYRELEMLREQSPPWTFDSPEQCEAWVREKIISDRGEVITDLRDQLRDMGDGIGTIITAHDRMRDERDAAVAALAEREREIREICFEHGREARALSDELARVTGERDALLLERDRGVPEVPEMDR